MFLELTQKVLRKIYYKVIARDHRVDRFFRYRNPKEYWQKRGGEQYFSEQEAVLDRTLRSDFIAKEIRKLNCASLLEVGSGYGKQLKNLYREGVFIAGCDFSHSQLLKARDYLRGLQLALIESDAEQLPFRAGSFDVVLSSAVILHNEPEKARRILSELIRVGRRYLVFNEDTDLTFSRYGYDMKKSFESMGFKILHSGPIPSVEDSRNTQFTIVDLEALRGDNRPEKIALRYHDPSRTGDRAPAVAFKRFSEY